MSSNLPYSHGSGEQQVFDLFDQDGYPDVERLRSEIEYDVSELLLHTPPTLRTVTWQYSEITDDQVFHNEMGRAREMIDYYWQMATLCLLEGAGAHGEYTSFIRKIRDAHLILDALENSGKGPGECV